jgi:hypothetical protein
MYPGLIGAGGDRQSIFLRAALWGGTPPRLKRHGAAWRARTAAGERVQTLTCRRCVPIKRAGSTRRSSSVPPSHVIGIWYAPALLLNSLWECARTASKRDNSSPFVTDRTHRRTVGAPLMPVARGDRPFESGRWAGVGLHRFERSGCDERWWWRRATNVSRLLGAPISAAQLSVPNARIAGATPSTAKLAMHFGSGGRLVLRFGV